MVVTLAQLKPGQVGIIREAHLDAPERELLSAMGVACDCPVRVCRAPSAGGPCIVACSARLGGGSCRIGLARALAERITVSLAGAP